MLNTIKDKNYKIKLLSQWKTVLQFFNIVCIPYLLHPESCDDSRPAVHGLGQLAVACGCWWLVAEQAPVYRLHLHSLFHAIANIGSTQRREAGRDNTWVTFPPPHESTSTMQTCFPNLPPSRLCTSQSKPKFNQNKRCITFGTFLFVGFFHSTFFLKAEL